MIKTITNIKPTYNRNIKMFGARGDGISDDTDAFKTAAILGGSYYVPAGTYRLTAPITVTEKDFCLFGEGQRLSVLLWDCDSGGMQITQNASGISGSTSKYYQTDIRNLSLLTTASSGASGWALSLTGSQNAVLYGRNRKTFQIENVEIAGVDSRNNGWRNGILVQDVNYPEFRNIMLNGWQNSAASSASSGYYYNMDKGINVITNGVNELNGVYINGGRIKNCARPITIYGTGEGVIISNFTISVSYEGINIDRTDDYETQTSDPMVMIHNCHVSSVYRSIYCKFSYEVFITSCLLYAFNLLNNNAGYGTETSYSGIYLDRCYLGRIAGNTIEGYRDARTDTTRGITLKDCTGTLITDNIAVNVDDPVFVTGTSTRNTIRDNERSPSYTDTNNFVTFDTGTYEYKNNVGTFIVSNTSSVTLASSGYTNVVTTPYYFLGGYKYLIKSKALITVATGTNVTSMKILKYSGAAVIDQVTPLTTTENITASGSTTQEVSFECYVTASTPGECVIALQAIMNSGTSQTIPIGSACVTIERK